MRRTKRVGHGDRGSSSVDGERREVLLGLVSGAATLLTSRASAAAANPAKEPPQPGDELVFAEGPSKGTTIGAADLPLGGPMVGAWAKDPATGTVRRASRLHRVLLLRLDPASLDAKTKARAAEGGIVAYSGFCTHAGCPIQHVKQASATIHCHCHGSEFDPRANGRVVTGPARRPLAGLPITLEGDRLLVAGPFAGKLGPPKA